MKEWDAGKKIRGFPVSRRKRSDTAAKDRGFTYFICRRWDPLCNGRFRLFGIKCKLKVYVGCKIY